MVKTQVDIVI